MSMHRVSMHLIYAGRVFFIPQFFSIRFSLCGFEKQQYYSFFFFLTEKRIRIRIQKKNRNDEFTLLIYSFFPIYTLFLTILLKILLTLYTPHYPKILILFYKIYFKIIAINLFKKIHPSTSPKPSQMLETFHSIMWIIESNELIQLR